MLLYDTTETRNLPENLKSPDSLAVAGLEDLTGADLIISPLSIPATPNALLLRHASTGLCVQRKTVGDLLSSFTDKDNRLWFQLSRLLEVTTLPWLLVIGDIKCNRDGLAVVDGRETSWEYVKIIAALDWWQLRGGYVTWLSRETLIYSWCKMWQTRLENRDTEYGDGKGWGEKIISRPVQQTVYEVPNVVRTLMTFPGMGEERAMAVYRATKEKIVELRGKDTVGDITLMDCLFTLDGEKVEGIGNKTRRSILEYVGWTQENGETND